MSTQVILVIIAMKLAMAVAAGVLVWWLLRLDHDEGGGSDGGGGGGGGGPRVRPGPRVRGPHGGKVLPAPPRARTSVQRRRTRHRV